MRVEGYTALSKRCSQIARFLIPRSVICLPSPTMENIGLSKVMNRREFCFWNITSNITINIEGPKWHGRSCFLSNHVVMGVTLDSAVAEFSTLAANPARFWLYGSTELPAAQFSAPPTKLLVSAAVRLRSRQDS